ncbi:MAG: hypothetical protein AAFQ90_02835, partial [Pseudomonadota bacterium]
MRWPLLVGLVLFHAAALVLLTKALAPGVASTVQREVIAAFDVPPAPLPAPPPPENRPEPDEGQQGAPAERAVAAPVAAPRTRLPLTEPEPLPKASSTGS